MEERSGSDRGSRMPDWVRFGNDDDSPSPLAWALIGLAAAFVVVVACRAFHVPWQYLYMVVSVVVIVVGFWQLRRRLDGTNRKWLPYHFVFGVLVLGVTVIVSSPPPGWKPSTQTPLPAQQAAAPQPTTAQPEQAEAPPPVPEIEIPEIEPGNMRSVIAHNQAVRVAESLHNGGSVNMRKQLAESSTSGSQQDVSQSADMNMREVLKSQKGFEPGDSSAQPKDVGKKSPWDMTKEVIFFVLVLFILGVLTVLCLREDTHERARPVAVFIGGFMGGYLFFIHCIWMSLKVGMVAGLIAGIALLWIYSGWSQPPESRRRGGENFIDGIKNRWSWLDQRWRDRRNRQQGGGSPPQPPIVPGGTSGGTS